MKLTPAENQEIINFLKKKGRIQELEAYQQMKLQLEVLQRLTDGKRYMSQEEIDLLFASQRGEK